MRIIISQQRCQCKPEIRLSAYRSPAAAPGAGAPPSLGQTEPEARNLINNFQHQRQWRDYEYSVRQVMRVVERTIDKKGQVKCYIPI